MMMSYSIGFREKPLTLDDLKDTQTVVIWGKDLVSTHKDWLPCLADKYLIVIDPECTDLAQQAHLHIQIKPQYNLHLALLLSRFTIIEGSHDKEFLDQHAQNYEEFYELTQSVRVKTTLEAMGVSLGQLGEFLELLRERRAVIIVGPGVKNSENGDETLNAIDAFAMISGLFGKHGCGIGFLGDKVDESLFSGKFEFMDEVDLGFSNIH